MPLILDLCGGTGSWSQPYVDAGYEVLNVTLPEFDVRTFQPPAHVHGILAAPPCTEFAVSGARWWAKKSPDLLRQSLAIVQRCLEIIEEAHPKWWALENPVGRLCAFIGPWVEIWDPCDYGDPWTKRTCLWGTFTMPIKKRVEPSEGSKLHRLPPSKDRAMLRSITPAGFAKAFFKANP